jgi:hypothetical protein
MVKQKCRGYGKTRAEKNCIAMYCWERGGKGN